MATDRRLTLVINPDVTKFSEALDALLSGVKQTTDQYKARWIEQAWTRPVAQARMRWLRAGGWLDNDDDVIHIARKFMDDGELPTVLAILVERDLIKRALSTEGVWF